MIIKNVLFSSGKLIRCGLSERLGVEQQVPEGIAIGVVIVHCVMECVLESSIGFYGRSPFLKTVVFPLSLFVYFHTAAKVSAF